MTFTFLLFYIAFTELFGGNADFQTSLKNDLRNLHNNLDKVFLANE